MMTCNSNFFKASEGRRGSSQSDTSALVSSIPQDLSQSPSQITQPRDISPTGSASSVQTHSESSPVNTLSTKITVSPYKQSRPILQHHFFRVAVNPRN